MLYQVTLYNFKCLAVLCLDLLTCNAECGGLFSQMKFEWRQSEAEQNEGARKQPHDLDWFTWLLSRAKGRKANTLLRASRQRSAVASNDHIQAPCDRTKRGRAKGGVGQLWLFCMTFESTSSLAEPARSCLKIPHLVEVSRSYDLSFGGQVYACALSIGSNRSRHLQRGIVCNSGQVQGV